MQDRLFENLLRLIIELYEDRSQADAILDKLDDMWHAMPKEQRLVSWKAFIEAFKGGPFTSYIPPLLQLHRVGSQSDESDVIRDEMDEPWYAMTEGQRELCGRISEELYKDGPEGGDRIDEEVVQ